MRLVLAGSGNGNNSFGHKVYRGIHIERDEWEDHKQADTRSTDAIGKRKSRVDFSFFNGVSLKEFGTEGMGWIDGWMHQHTGKKRDGNGFGLETGRIPRHWKWNITSSVWCWCVYLSCPPGGHYGAGCLVCHP